MNKYVIIPREKSRPYLPGSQRYFKLFLLVIEQKQPPFCECFTLLALAKVLYDF